MLTRTKLDRQTIILTAAEIADAEGLENVTLTAVAKSLNVQKPSLYNHINGLPDLRGQLAVWGTNQLQAIISHAAIGKSKCDAIRAVADAYRLFAHQRPGLYRAILSSPDRNNMELKAALKNMMATLSLILEPYGLTTPEDTHAVRSLRSLLHGFVAMEAEGWFIAPVDQDESYQHLINIFIHGLEHQN